MGRSESTVSSDRSVSHPNAEPKSTIDNVASRSFGRAFCAMGPNREHGGKE
jgi:hypothetical protein